MTADAFATGDPSDPARARHVVGIGASAGGVEALTGLVRELPEDLRAAPSRGISPVADASAVMPRPYSQSPPMG